MDEMHDVVIVGAGPTGLTLACDLRRRGFAPLLLDQQKAGANTSRAAVIHAHTLEVLEPLDVVPDLLAKGVEVSIFEMRDRDKVLLRTDFFTLPTRYNFALMCPQDQTEAVLLARLEALGGHVTRPARVTGFETDGDTIRVQLEGERTIATRWLVGCDGMRSTVRESAGIGFVGSAYRQSFVLADVRLDGANMDVVTLFLAPDGLVVLAPLPNGHHRIVATMDDVPECPSRGDMQAILDHRGPRGTTLQVHDLVWSSRFHVHHRVAERLRVGRVMLCGDAAHVHSPAGGQGMNTGIQDAMDLGQALADVLVGAPTQPLDDWATRRHHIAERVVRLTDRMTRLGTAGSQKTRMMRNGMLGFVGLVPGLRRAIAFRIAGLDLR